jgi:diacylglycerol kinase (ATP)
MGEFIHNLLQYHRFIPYRTTNSSFFALLAFYISARLCYFSPNMKAAIVVNPVSGRGKALGLLPKVVAWCQKEGIEFRIYPTAEVGDGANQANIALQAGFERIVVLGGDGTINEVGQALAGTETLMGVLPGGSGNDFFKMLGKKIGFEKALKIAFKGVPHDVDVGLANGRLFFNVIGIGFDAQVAAEAAKSKTLSGLLVYLKAVFKVWRTYKPLPLEIELDQLKLTQNVTLVSIGNGRASGGGFYLTPQAKYDDGLFDICLMEYFPKSKIFTVLPRAIKGTHVRLEGVRIYRSKRIVIRSAEGFPVHIDGEPQPEPLEKFEITVDRRKLRVSVAEESA